MKNYTKSGSSLFLLELLLNLLLFSVLMVVGLNFFIKAHTITNNTNSLHRAVTACNNVATLYEGGDGTLSVISRYYVDSIVAEDKAYVYFDKEFNECTSKESSYILLIEITDKNSALKKAAIKISSETETLYSSTVCNYRQLTPSSGEVAQ